MYINTQTLNTYASHSDVRADFPLVSLPSSLTDEMLASIGVQPVEQATPGHNPIAQSATELPPALVGGKWVQQWQITDLSPEQAAANRAATRAAAALQIDEAVAAIYGRFTRFQLEYTEREAQAQAYKDAGYTGEVPPRVVEFAIPAGMPAQAATDLILAQAANLRTAQGELSALRMRKYEVMRAASDAAAQTVAAEILAGVESVGRAVQ